MFYNYKGAFLINLKDDSMRKNEFLKQWNNDWKLEFIEAVDGRGDLWHKFACENKISIEATTELISAIKNKKRKYHESLTEGAVGCYLSHMKCWEACLNNKDGDYCLILEDDSIIPEDIFSKIDEIVNELKIKWGIINLGWASTTPPKQLNGNLFVVDRFFLNHAYLLSNHGAETLLRLHKKIEKQVDAFMSDNSSEIIILGLIKNICFQNLEMKTNIQTMGVENIKFKNQNDYIVNYHR
jgi:GR25 family glycosyltransferase involved in LPS biosynthesis